MVSWKNFLRLSRAWTEPAVKSPSSSLIIFNLATFLSQMMSLYKTYIKRYFNYESSTNSKPLKNSFFFLTSWKYVICFRIGIKKHLSGLAGFFEKKNNNTKSQKTQPIQRNFRQKVNNNWDTSLIKDAKGIAKFRSAVCQTIGTINITRYMMKPTYIPGLRFLSDSQHQWNLKSCWWNHLQVHHFLINMRCWTIMFVGGFSGSKALLIFVLTDFYYFIILKIYY